MNRLTSAPGSPGATRAMRRGLSAVAVASLAFALAACTGTPPGTGETPSAGPDLGQCGVAPVIPAQDDPDNLVAGLPQEAQDAFSGFTQPIKASSWAEGLPAAGAPYTVGLSFLPVANAWATAAVAQIEADFAAAKDAGLVEGELLVQIPADAATMTAADQIAGYNKLVEDGADVILMYPLDGEAMQAPVDAAGEQGIPTITIVGNVPSTYAVNVGNNPFNYVAQPVAEAAKLLGGEGNLIIVAGIEGISITTVSLDAANQVLEACPDINVVGTVYGGYSNSVTKSALVTFLASHPEQIDAVLQIGTMGAGVWDAFASVGRPAPLVIDVGTTAASLAYWDQALASGYQGVGVPETAIQVVDSVWDVLLRTMAGEQPILNQIPVVPKLVTNDNLSQYVVPGEGTSSQADTQSVGPWIDSSFLDLFFNNPGA
ncbi:MAG TPA: substrate-binding domain-containing protein [Microbacteriaceae bacterium]|nr:substrate-binding domain-containing protein [Microbacteriaceae bacterium]